MNTQETQIRVARRSDLPALDALLSRSYGTLLRVDYPPDLLTVALPMIARAKPALVTCGTYYVVARAGALLAAGGWTRDNPLGGASPGDMGHVRHVVTCVDHQRQGVGRALMRHVMRDAQAAGVQRLECYSTRGAEAFYGAMGFVPVARIEIALRPGVLFPAVHMRARL